MEFYTALVAISFSCFCANLSFAVAPPNSGAETSDNPNSRVIFAVELTPNNEVIIPPKLDVDDERRRFAVDDGNYVSKSNSEFRFVDSDDRVVFEPLPPPSSSDTGVEEVPLIMQPTHDDALSSLKSYAGHREFPLFTGKAFHGTATRCYCNLPECVSSNYMCKSPSGRCFTEILDLQKRPIRTRNGCIEVLMKNGFEENLLPKTCALSNSDGAKDFDPANGRRNSLMEQTSSGYSDEGPLLKCCGDDFCNYGQNDIVIQVDSETDDWPSPAKSPSELENERRSSQQAQLFKVVTIVVPILGGFILTVLLAVAFHVYKKGVKRDLEYAPRRLPAAARQQLDAAAAVAGTGTSGSAAASPAGTLTCLLLDETMVKDCCCYHQLQQQQSASLLR